MNKPKPYKKRTSGENKIFYRMILFIAGKEHNSLITKTNLLEFCKSNLKGFYELEIIDVLENYQAAIENNIVAVPTLIIKEPLPEKTIVGVIDNFKKLFDIFEV